jgi:hypothetical protein
MERMALIVYHKQATSARTRFLRGTDGCLFYGELVEGAAAHPAGLMQELARRLRVGMSDMALEPDFRAPQAAHGSVWLAQVKTVDPPMVEHLKDHRFVSLLDARDLPESELELLGAAYQAVLGGG